jgi:hypothetical protein
MGIGPLWHLRVPIRRRPLGVRGLGRAFGYLLPPPVARGWVVPLWSARARPRFLFRGKTAHFRGHEPSPGYLLHRGSLRMDRAAGRRPTGGYEPSPATSSVGAGTRFSVRRRRRRRRICASPGSETPGHESTIASDAEGVAQSGRWRDGSWHPCRVRPSVRLVSPGLRPGAKRSSTPPGSRARRITISRVGTIGVPGTSPPRPDRSSSCSPCLPSRCARPTPQLDPR